LDDGVTEEFEALVRLRDLRLILQQGGMREGAFEQLTVPEAVREAFLKD